MRKEKQSRRGGGTARWAAAAAARCGAWWRCSVAERHARKWPMAMASKWVSRETVRRRRGRGQFKCWRASCAVGLYLVAGNKRRQAGLFKYLIISDGPSFLGLGMSCRSKGKNRKEHGGSGPGQAWVWAVCRLPFLGWRKLIRKEIERD